jgi:flavin reductase ActVB
VSCNNARPATVTPSTPFREAMATFPSGVTIVTTTDRDARPRGFTATAFCSVSADPPLVLVCLAKSAECHPTFLDADAWVVHVIHSDHRDLAVQFATRGADKFGDAGFEVGVQGIPVLTDAAVVLHCSTHARHDGGDHTILIGHVDDVTIGTEEPAVYFRRAFHTLAR